MKTTRVIFVRLAQLSDLVFTVTTLNAKMITICALSATFVMAIITKCLK